MLLVLCENYNRRETRYGVCVKPGDTIEIPDDEYAEGLVQTGVFKRAEGTPKKRRAAAEGSK